MRNTTFQAISSMAMLTHANFDLRMRKINTKWTYWCTHIVVKIHTIFVMICAICVIVDLQTVFGIMLSMCKPQFFIYNNSQVIIPQLLRMLTTAHYAGPVHSARQFTRPPPVPMRYCI